MLNKFSLSIFYFILFFLIFLLSGSVYLMANNSIRIITLLMTMVISLLHFLFMIKSNKSNFKYYNPIILVSFLLLYSTLQSFFFNDGLGNPSSINQLFENVLIFLTVFFIVNSIPFNLLIKNYIYLITFISVVSLFYFISINYFYSDFPYKIVSQNNIPYKQYLFYFEFTFSSERNLGIFWEPGLFASFLLLGITFIIFLKKIKKLLLVLIILTITLITTYSTAGYLIFLIIIVFAVFRNLKSKLLTFSLMLFVFTLLFNYKSFFTFLSEVSPSIFSKLIEGENTLTDRLLSPIVNLSVSLSSPIIGHGFYNANILYSILMVDFGVESQTSTYFYFISSLGVFGLFFILTIHYYIFKLRFNFASKVFLSIILLLIFNKEPHTFLVISNIVLLSFVGLYRRKRIVLE
jgi:hypothetical protein